MLGTFLINPIEGILTNKDFFAFLLGTPLMVGMMLFSKKPGSSKKRIGKTIDDDFLFSSSIVFLAIIIGFMGWGITREKVKNEIQNQYRLTTDTD